MVAAAADWPVPLDLVAGSGLLSPDDASNWIALREDVEESFATAQVFRTETEMRVSVLGDFVHPTPDSKYWQAVREQDVHATELVHLSYEYRKRRIALRRLENQLEAESDALEAEAIALEIQHSDYLLSLMERQAYHRMREIALWKRIKSELRPHLKHGIDDVNAHQLETMRKRWANEARLVNDHTPPADARNILGLASSAREGWRP